MNKQII